MKTSHTNTRHCALTELLADLGHEQAARARGHQPEPCWVELDDCPGDRLGDQPAVRSKAETWAKLCQATRGRRAEALFDGADDAARGTAIRGHAESAPPELV